jgi:hypothetical protein
MTRVLHLAYLRRRSVGNRMRPRMETGVGGLVRVFRPRASFLGVASSSVGSTLGLVLVLAFSMTIQCVKCEGFGDAGWFLSLSEIFLWGPRVQGVV